MATLKFSNKVIIAGLKESIARLESQIESQYWQKGYVENCKATIESYKLQIAKLEPCK